MRSTQPPWNSFPMPLPLVSTTSLVLMDQCYYWKSTKRLEIIGALPFAIFLCPTSKRQSDAKIYLTENNSHVTAEIFIIVIVIQEKKERKKDRMTKKEIMWILHLICIVNRIHFNGFLLKFNQRFILKHPTQAGDLLMGS